LIFNSHNLIITPFFTSKSSSSSSSTPFIIFKCHSFVYPLLLHQFLHCKECYKKVYLITYHDVKKRYFGYHLVSSCHDLVRFLLPPCLIKFLYQCSGFQDLQCWFNVLLEASNKAGYIVRYWC
jgi:hypothetical protein